MVNVKIKKLVDDAVIPFRATPGSAGMDITAIDYEYDDEKDVHIYHTGLAFELPVGYVMYIFPRSSNRKTNCYLPNSVGILDSDYRGELLICYKDRTNIPLLMRMARESSDVIDDVDRQRYNFQDSVQTILSDVDFPDYASSLPIDDWEDELIKAPYKVGDRIAQIVITKYPEVSFEEVETLSDTERGAGGFGHSDKKC